MNDLDLAAELWAKLRSNVETPIDAVNVIVLIAYKVWSSAEGKTITLREYADDFRDSLVAFHAIQDIQGNA